MGGVPANMEGTVLGVTVGSRLAAAIALVDSPKPNAGAVVAELKKRMLRVHLVSGDTARTARAVGTAVGIPDENIHAEIRPEAKAGIVEKLQREGQRVAFIGDGINDAPALAQADLGIAVTRASDVARESADILLLKNDIEAIPEALGLCVATLRTIKQNLFWAFFYNAAAIDGKVIEPTMPAVASHEYPMSKPLLLMINGPPMGNIKTLLKFMLGPAGQELLHQHSYFTLKELGLKPQPLD